MHNLMSYRTIENVLEFFEQNENDRVILYIDGGTLKSRIVSQCSKCEKITETSVEKLIFMNQNCTCVQYKEASKKFAHESEKFFKLCTETHNGNYEYFNDYVNSKTKITIKCKLCQKTFVQNAGSHLYDKHGCPNCIASNLEKKFISFLETRNLKYEKEKKFTWCRPNNKIAPYDFYVNEFNALIEIHGKQHYEILYPYIRTKEELYYRKRIDRYKAYLAKVHRFNYIEIPYNQIENTEIIFSAITQKQPDNEIFWDEEIDRYPLYKYVIADKEVRMVVI